MAIRRVDPAGARHESLIAARRAVVTMDTRRPPGDRHQGPRREQIWPGGTVPLAQELTDTGRAWNTFASADPLWAIYVRREAKRGGWDEAAFYATGAAEIEAVLSRARQLGLQTSGQSALDFGCGAGRLTRPLASHFELVTGVDVAPGMLELAQRDNPVRGRCRFLLNTRPDLAMFGTGEFDLVYSSIVLQHISPGLTRAYLPEFARVLRPGGSLIVHLPTHPRWTMRGFVYRFLPQSALGLIQRRLLGYAAPMRMHGMAEAEVRALLAAHGVEVVATASVAYCPDWYELRYFCRRHRS